MLKSLLDLSVEEASVEINKNSDYFLNSNNSYCMKANGRIFFTCKNGLVEAKHVLINAGSYQDDYVEIIDVYRAYDTDILEEEIEKIKQEAKKKINEMKNVMLYLKNKQDDEN